LIVQYWTFPFQPLQKYANMPFMQKAPNIFFKRHTFVLRLRILTLYKFNASIITITA
jgi:hypothetical protein